MFTDDKDNLTTVEKDILKPKLRARPPKNKAFNKEKVLDHNISKEKANVDEKGEALCCVRVGRRAPSKAGEKRVQHNSKH